MKLVLRTAMLAGLLMGPCAATEGGASRAVVVSYGSGTFQATQIGVAADECNEFPYRGYPEGRVVAYFDGTYFIEAFGCTIPQEPVYPIRCGGGSVGGLALPTVEIDEFALTDTDFHLKGTMGIDTKRYCFKVDGPVTSKQRGIF